MIVQLYSFEAFGKDQTNAARSACTDLAHRGVNGVEFTHRVLPCEFFGTIDELRKEILRVQPDVVIVVGQGGGRPDLTIERVAINIDDAVKGQDNRGRKPVEELILTGAPFAYRSSIATEDCARFVREIGVPCSISHTAGTFVCNHVFFLLSHLVVTEDLGIPIAFIHVPYTPQQATLREKMPSMSTETAVAGLTAVIEFIRDKFAETRERNSESGSLVMGRLVRFTGLRH
jgi:pyroglutamyl-peptidase